MRSNRLIKRASTSRSSPVSTIGADALRRSSNVSAKTRRRTEMIKDYTIAIGASILLISLMNLSYPFDPTIKKPVPY
jgi:hypothetical protein